MSTLRLRRAVLVAIMCVSGINVFASSEGSEEGAPLLAPLPKDPLPEESYLVRMIKAGRVTELLELDSFDRIDATTPEVYQAISDRVWVWRSFDYTGDTDPDYTEVCNLGRLSARLYKGTRAYGLYRCHRYVAKPLGMGVTAAGKPRRELRVWHRFLQAANEEGVTFEDRLMYGTQVDAGGAGMWCSNPLHATQHRGKDFFSSIWRRLLDEEESDRLSSGGRLKELHFLAEFFDVEACALITPEQRERLERLRTDGDGNRKVVDAILRSLDKKSSREACTVM